MPKLLPIQHTFEAGELTPRMRARSDLDLYSKGVQYTENMAPLTQGPLVARPGSDYYYNVIGSSGRVFIFQQSWDVAFAVMISDSGNLHVTDEIEQIGQELVKNGDFNNGFSYWSKNETDGSVVVENGFLLLTSTSHATKGIVEAYQNVETDTPGNVHNIVVNMPVDAWITIDIRIGTTIGGTDIYSATTGSDLHVASFTPNVSSFWVTLYKAGTTDTTKSVDKVSIRAEVDAITADPFAHPWTNNLEWIHAKMPPGEDKMYFTHPNFPPQVLEHVGGGVWSFGAVTFTSPPAEWTGTTYPRALAFFEGRSWWGGPGELFTASKSADQLNLTTGTLDEDAFTFEMAKRGEIVWMSALKNLLIGTRTSEHIITSESGVITPTDVLVEEQSAYGSNYAQTTELGSKAAYVTGDGRKLHDIGYQWTAEQWLSNDLLHAAEHLTEDAFIDEFVWVQNPAKQIGCVLNNGGFIMCLYDPSKEIIGWSRVKTEGYVHSVAKIDIFGKSSFVLLVSRNAKDGSSNPLLYLEKFDSRVYLDSANSEYSDTPKNTIDDGIHLANKTVKVLIDDAAHPDVELDSNGEATLNWSGNYITYGLGYLQKTELLPRDFPMEGGSTTGGKKRWNKVWVRIKSSVVPRIASIDSPDRSPQTPMDSPELMKSTDIQVTTLDYGDGSFVIENELPYKLEILGVFGEMNISKVG